MSCSNYVAKTFAHVAGLVGVSAIGTRIEMLEPAAEFMKTGGTVVKVVKLIVFIGLFMLFMMMQPGPLKYIAAVAFALFFGAGMAGLVDKLIAKEDLTRILVNLTAVSVAMIGLAVWDKSGKLLTWLPVLFVGLIAVTITSLYYYFKDEKRPKWLSAIIGALFAVFIAVDTQIIRKNAAICRPGSADYINESFGLYLDILNLFQALASD
jgi:FtsH-binding integral membrane protein